VILKLSVDPLAGRLQDPAELEEYLEDRPPREVDGEFMFCYYGVAFQGQEMVKA